MEPTILSIDCGTQSLRAILFSLTGDILDKEQILYEPYYSKKPGWAEQDATIYWKSLCRATQALKARSPAYFNTIKGVGLTTQRNTLINVDREGNPLRPCTVWLDQRKAIPEYQPNFLIGSLLRVLGLKKSLEEMEADAKCNWIRQNEPEIWEKTHKYVQVSGFLNFKLTNEFADSVASQIGHIPFNYKKQDWISPSEKLEFGQFLFPVPAEKLPRLVPAGEELGKISEAASLLTGIQKGIPVIACGSDKGCETLGMGTLDNSTASLSFGTTATVQTTVDKYMEPLPFIPAYPAALPGHWNPEMEIFRGFWMITWFKNEFALKEVLEAAEKNIPAEVIMDQLLRDTPPGAMGLIVQPYWSPGLGEKNAKGAMIGFGDVHKKAHVYRAVIEGLGYGLLDGTKRLEKRGKMKFKQFTAAGGGAQSDEICQIMANIFNKPILRGKTHESSGLGAAILTAYGVNQYTSIKEAVKNMVVYKDTFEPNREHAKIYKALFEKVYLKMFKRLAPLYKDIKEITGYPAD